MLTNTAIEAAAVNVNSKNKKLKQPRDLPPKQPRDPPPKTDPKQSKDMVAVVSVTSQESTKHMVKHAKNVRAKIILPTCALPKTQILATENSTRSSSSRTPTQTKISSSEN